MRIIPRLDIKNDYLIKPIRYEGLRNLGKPEEYAERYYKEGATEIVVIDNVASLYNRPSSFSTFKNISEKINIPLTVCGGIKNINDVYTSFENGADKIALNTSLFNAKTLINEIASRFGSQSCVISIEAKKLFNQYECLTKNGRERTYKRLFTWIKEVEDKGAGEIYLSSVDMDGVEKGFDIELIEEASETTSIPLVISSGFGKIEHLKELKKFPNISGISIGSALHYNKIDLREIIEYYEK